MSKLKHYVASVFVSSKGVSSISYYASRGTGLFLTSDYYSPHILHYDTIDEAEKAKVNASDCVLTRLVETAGVQEEVKF